MRQREVRHDPDTASRGPRAGRAPRVRPGERLALEDQHPVRVEHECLDAAEGGAEVGRTDLAGRRSGMMAAYRNHGGASDGTARREDGAHLRRRQRPLDRLGRRAGAARRGRRGRFLVRREPHREAGPATGGVDRLDVRGTVRRHERRRHRARLRALGRVATIRSTSSSTPSRSRDARTSKVPSSTPRATASHSRSTCPRIRWWRSPRVHGRTCGAGRRS